MAKKCQSCDESATNQFQGEWYCWDHYSKKTRKSRFIKGILAVAVIISVIINVIQFFL